MKKTIFKSCTEFGCTGNCQEIIDMVDVTEYLSGKSFDPQINVIQILGDKHFWLEIEEPYE